jgi:hypothetical protein
MNAVGQWSGWVATILVIVAGVMLWWIKRRNEGDDGPKRTTKDEIAPVAMNPVPVNRPPEVQNLSNKVKPQRSFHLPI